MAPPGKLTRQPGRVPDDRMRGMTELQAEPGAWVTGENSPNHTATRWEVSGTDLGICWDDRQGGVLIAFGDTFHPRQPEGGGGGGDWRSNVLARSTSKDLSRGLIFDSMVEDRPGHAREVLPSKKINGVEVTTIPTGGCSIGDHSRSVQIVAYMSIKRYGAPGRWETNHSGLACSTDGGQTWTKDPGAIWRNTPTGDHRFQMMALVRHEGSIYLVGTPNGRAGSAYLARAPEADLLDPTRHEYWDGTGWQPDERRAAPIITAPVSELSVMYHKASGQWLAGHYRENLDAVVVHTALELTGSWSEPHIIATATDYPGLYGTFFHPWTADDLEPTFLMSQWGPYNVRLMRLVGLAKPEPDPEPAPTRPSWLAWIRGLLRKLLGR